MNFARGFIATAVWATLGIVVPGLIVCAFFLASWHAQEATTDDRLASVDTWRHYFTHIHIAIPIYLGLAAWATFTPKGKGRFASSLSLIFFLGFPLTYCLASMQLTPQRRKHEDHPDIYFSEFLLLFLPPLTIACGVFACRVWMWTKIQRRGLENATKPSKA